MKMLLRRVFLVLSVTLLLISKDISFGQDPNSVLFQYTGQTLKDSKWGKIALFQAALSNRLHECEQNGIRVDGEFGSYTQAGLMKLMACPDFKDAAVVPEDPLYSTVHTELWTKLLPNTSIPSVHERAFVLSLSHEDTDYDEVQWNYGTSDDKSVLTWGPYGATVGHGKEIQGILKSIHNDDPKLLKKVFGEEYSIILELIGEGSDGYTLLTKVYRNKQRRKDWVDKFKILSSHNKVREYYEQYAKSDKWLKPPINRLYSLLPNGVSDGTEIDYAFFLDNAMHMSITTRRINECKKAIDKKHKELGRNLTPPERRQVVSLNLIPSMQRDDRLGRNVVYYVDGIGVNNLSLEESGAWRRRTGRKASDCGLSDERKYTPEFL